MSLHQDHDETLTTRVRSRAENCDFPTVSECECGKNATSYTEEAIKYVMLAGVGDDDIRSS